MKDIIIIAAMLAAAIFGLPFVLRTFAAGGTDEPALSAGASVRFPDTVRLYMTETQEIRELSARDYLIGCLYAQIPINYQPEALKAQAAASATYAMKLMQTLPESGKLPDGADISDDKQLCQPYFTEDMISQTYGADADKYRENIERAADYGLSHIITYEGEPIYSVYCSVSAGKTCPSEYIWGVKLGYLRRAESPWDREYMHFETVNEMKADDMLIDLIIYDPNIEVPADYSKWFTDFNVNEEGYVISVNIGQNTFSGGDMWRIFGLRSPAFTVSYSGGIFSFTTRGYGHGAGLSQYGANAMAVSGSTAEEILRHYYGEDVSF